MSAETSKTVNTIRNSGARLLNLINDILDAAALRKVRRRGACLPARAAATGAPRMRASGTSATLGVAPRHAMLTLSRD